MDMKKLILKEKRHLEKEIDALVMKHGILKEKIVKRVDELVKEYRGLLSCEGALFIIMKELEVGKFKN